MDFSATGTKQRKAFQGLTKRWMKQWSIGGKTIYHKKKGKPRSLPSEKKAALRLKRQTTTRVKTNRRRVSSALRFDVVALHGETHDETHDETPKQAPCVSNHDFDAEEYVQWLINFGFDWE